jgi:hypothetical protein
MDNVELIAARGREICEKNGYRDYTLFENGRDACIAKIGFNHAILSDLGEYGYAGRWCYATYLDALIGLHEWDGEGEPYGWHRDPVTGRRRPDGDASKETRDE